MAMKDYEIAITHFINPQLFWFHKVTVPNDEYSEVLDLEHHINLYWKRLSTCASTDCSVQVNDLMMMRYFAWSKIIRVKIIYILKNATGTKQEYIVWAIDYGFPILTKGQYLRHLPKQFSKTINRIVCGSLSRVWPAESCIDFKNKRMVLVHRENWCEYSSKLINKLLIDAASLVFQPHFSTPNGQIWGELIISCHTGEKIIATQHLVSEEYATYDTKDFRLRAAEYKWEEKMIYEDKYFIQKLQRNLQKDAKPDEKLNFNVNCKDQLTAWVNALPADTCHTFDEETVFDEINSHQNKSDDHVDDVELGDSCSVINYNEVCENRSNNSAESSANKNFPMSSEIDSVSTRMSRERRQKALAAFKQSVKELQENSYANRFVNECQIQQMQNLNLAHDARYAQKPTCSNSAVNPAFEVRNAKFGAETFAEVEEARALPQALDKTAVNRNKISDSATCQNAALADNYTCISSDTNPFAAKATTEIEANHELPFHLDNIEIDKGKLFDAVPIFSNLDANTQMKITLPEFDTNKKSVYDDLFLVPAGIDMTKFNTYKNEDTHWHRMKTTRNIKSLEEIDTSVKRKAFASATTSVQRRVNADTNATNRNVANRGRTVQGRGYHIANYIVEPQVGMQKVTLTDSTTNSSHSDRSISSNVSALTRRSLEQCANTVLPRSLRLSSNRDKDRNMSTNNVLHSDEKSVLITRPQIDTSDNKVDSKSKRYDIKAHNPKSAAKADVETIATESAEISNAALSESGSSLSRATKQQWRKLKSPEKQAIKINSILTANDVELSNANRFNFKRNSNNSSLNSVSSLIERSSDCIEFVKESASKTNALRRNIADATVASNDGNTAVAAKGKVEHLVKHDTNKEKINKTMSNILETAEKPLKSMFIDHLTMAHGKGYAHCVDKLDESKFIPVILNEMKKLNFHEVYRVQSYAWPHLQRGNSLCIINTAKTGKTLAYLPAVCSEMLYNQQRCAVAATYGPICIILQPNSVQVECVSKLARHLLYQSGAKVVTAIGMRRNTDVKMELMNGCDMLISTPSCLLRLLQCNDREPLFNAKRLHHFVLDNMDAMVKHAAADFEQAVKYVLKLCKTERQPQLVVTTRKWDSRLIQILRVAHNPLLVIGDFLEAAVYGKIHFTMKVLESKQKLEFVLHQVQKQNLQSVRLMIMCGSDEDALDVYDYLLKNQCSCIVCHSHATMSELNCASDWKKQQNGQVLICVDDIFRELAIQDCDLVIQYSMPSSWTLFKMRFAAIMRKVRNRVAENFVEPPNSAAVPQMLVIVDKDKTLHLPLLMEFLKKHNELKQIDPEILQAEQDERTKREKERIERGVKLCSFFLEFGDCLEERCKYRHLLTAFDVDVENKLPSAGELSIKVLHVFSPTHYSVRLLQHKSPQSQNFITLPCAKDFAQIAIQLNMYYGNADKLVLHWPLALHDICIIKDNLSFKRVQVLKMPELKSQHNIKTINVTIKFLDFGQVTSVSSEELYICAAQFKELPAQAVDIRLMGIMPYDNERIWDPTSTAVVKNWIMNDITAEHAVHVAIDFILANTIWVNILVVMRRLPDLKRYIYHINLKRSLLQKQFALPTNESAIRDLAMKHGLLQCKAIDNMMDSNNGDDADNNTTNYSNGFHEDDDDDFKSCIFELSSQSINDEQTEVELSSPTMTMNTNSAEEDWDNLPDEPAEDEILITFKSNKTASDSNHNVKEALESWCELPLNQLVRVEIGNESENGNWQHLCLQRFDVEYRQKFEELSNEIAAYVKQQQQLSLPFDLDSLQPMENCIVKFTDKYLRAKLISRTDTSNYRFFLCDYSCFVELHSNDISNDSVYCSSKRIVEYMPYQAVSCILAAIELLPKQQAHLLSENYLFAYATKELSCNANAELANLPMPCYAILLYECDDEHDLISATMLNKQLVQLQLATVLPNEEQYLELSAAFNFSDMLNMMNEAYNADNEKENDNDNDDSVDDALAIKLFLQDLQRQNATAEVQQLLRTVEIVDEEKKLMKHKKDQTVEQKEKQTLHLANTYDTTTTMPTMPATPTNPTAVKKTLNEQNCFRAAYPNIKTPKTAWHENDYALFLIINAADMQDMDLKVTANTFCLTLLIDNECQILQFTFKYAIDASSVSCQLRGLNLHVRIKKFYFIKWHELLADREKPNWLTYHFDAMKPIDDNGNMKLLERVAVNQNTTSLESNYSDDEQHPNKHGFETFTPITNPDDFYDPMSEII